MCVCVFEQEDDSVEMDEEVRRRLDLIYSVYVLHRIMNRIM
jgi:hypothetical protein